MNSVNTPHVNIVAELLRRGAAVNYIGKGSATALHMAASGGRKESVKLLLESRARTDLQTDRGLVALEEPYTTLPQVVLVDIVFTPFPTQRAVAMATIGSATARLADIGPLAMT